MGHGKNKTLTFNAYFYFFFLVKPLQVKAPSSKCNVGGDTYDDGDSMQVYKGDLVSGECHQCTCSEGKLIDCHHIFHCVLNDSSCNSYSMSDSRGQCCPKCERGIAVSAAHFINCTKPQGRELEYLTIGRLQSPIVPCMGVAVP